MATKKIKCRVCKKVLKDYLCDLGLSPLANSFSKNKKLIKKEKYYPLKVYYCKNCFLPQIPQHVAPTNIFQDYDYFSSYSKSWLDHSKKYVNEIVKDMQLDKSKKICEIASNDGYLLQFFKKRGLKFLE